MSKTKQWAENTAEQKVDNIIAKQTIVTGKQMD